MEQQVIQTLLNSNPWTEYRFRIDILKQSADSEEVLEVRKKMISHPLVQSLVAELTDWPGNVINSHKSAGLLFHKLSFLADIGFTTNDEGIAQIIDKIFSHISEEGPFQVPMNIPEHFGGIGTLQYAWALCDAPVIVYSLAKLGMENDSRVLRAKDFLIETGRENGYPCFVSKELGKFRGPGKKEDPCPYASMIMLKILYQFNTNLTSEKAEKTIDSLLSLWEQSKSKHPYMFFMGTDFRKLKAPFIWYDILHLADTLSNFPYACNDHRFQNIVSVITEKVDSNGLYTPESEWKAWKDWDFGQKKQPSSWLTFLVYRLKMKAEENRI